MNSRLASFIERKLKLEDPDDAIEQVINSKYFPQVLCDNDYQKLPEILKIICDVRAFYINSGAAGLVGLFSDSSTRLALNEFVARLTRMNARRSLEFLAKLQHALPKGRFPKNDVEAANLVALLINAQAADSTASLALRRLMGEYAQAVASLPEELRKFLVKNKGALVEALSEK